MLLWSRVSLSGLEMSHYLLTGAGFTHNWGGWLADEAFEYLLGCSEITPHIRNLLWKNKVAHTGFEGALQELRDEYIRSNQELNAGRQLNTLDRLLLGMFNSMDRGYGDFEPGMHERMGPQPTNIRDFLCRFDAIFTLNQDTLLEQKYHPSDFLEGSQGKWNGSRSPGLQEEHINGTRYAAPGVFRPLDPPFTIPDRIQPYFKLHGSSNWRAFNGFSILIMGQNKGKQIERVPLLDWYRAQFRQMVCQAEAKLMVIGYSFRDEHINEIIEAAAQKGTKLFVIDPLGIDVLNYAPQSPTNPRLLRDKVRESIIGASRRPFLSTFTGNRIELAKIMRFFSGFP
jgi:hypothetical protein